MILKGTSINSDEDNRVFTFRSENKDYLIHLTIKEFKEFKPYIDSNDLEMILDCEEGKTIKLKNEKEALVYDFNHFDKISSLDGTKVYFDIEDIKVQTKDFLNSLNYKMFLDLEFSWPVPYTHMPTEIVQYGYIITDKDDNVVEKKSGLLKPTRKSALNKKTLKFLNKSIEEFDNAETYISFYQNLERCIKKYDCKFIAWGRNDLLQIQQSFRLNHLAPLEVKSRFINIMQVIKNYYRLKNEIGLFNTYKTLTNQDYHEQTHDALEDAYLAKEIYEIFKNKLNDNK